MRFRELGKGVKTVVLPYGIFDDAGVCLATAPDGGRCANLGATESGFRKVDEGTYNDLITLSKTPLKRFGLD